MKKKVTDVAPNTIKKWKSYAVEITKDLNERRIFFNANDSSVELSPSECIRAVSEKFTEDPVRNLLLKCMVDAESRSAGSSFVMLSMIAGLEFPDVKRGSRFSIKKLQKGLAKLTDHFSSEIVIDSVKLAGRSGKIIVDRTTSTNSEIVYGSQACKWKPDLSFFSSLGKNSISVQNCKLIFIDGIIESVSECHRLFQTSYEEKIAVTIFARGFSEEINATAAINFQRGTAQVIPIVVNFDEVGVNSLGDLASCFGADVISSDKGQLISSVDVKDHPTVSRIKSTTDVTEIESSKNQIESVVNKLSIKMRSVDSMNADLVRKRIDAIGAGTVTIKIGADRKSCAGITRDRVDFGIRFIRDCMMSGIVEHENLILPSRSIQVGKKCAESFIKSIERSGAIVGVDKCG